MEQAAQSFQDIGDLYEKALKRWGMRWRTYHGENKDVCSGFPARRFAVWKPLLLGSYRDHGH
jgi:hypothetical protein